MQIKVMFCVKKPVPEELLDKAYENGPEDAEWLLEGDEQFLAFNRSGPSESTIISSIRTDLAEYGLELINPRILEINGVQV